MRTLWKHDVGGVRRGHDHEGDALMAFVATGTSFADALAGGPVATVHGGPTLLTARDALHRTTRSSGTRRMRPPI